MSNEVLSQEQIEQMLVDAGQIEESDQDAEMFSVDSYLTADEQDLLGEIGNICMGTSATTMSTLLGRKVDITTPRLSIHTVETLSKEYPAPLVISEIKYTEGLEGDNLLILNEYDVALITSVMLGEEEDKIDPDNIELTEIHMSAIGEVMNQMVGSSATALADILHKLVDISTPKTRRLTIKDENLSESFAKRSGPFVKISFNMEIENLLVSEIMQVLSVDFAKQMADSVWKQMQIDAGISDAQSAPEVQAASSGSAEPAQSAQAAPQASAAPQAPAMAAEVPQTPQFSPQAAYTQAPAIPNVIHEEQNVRVQQPQFPSFNGMTGTMPIPSLENIEMILDVPMNVTVELGRTKKKIKDILEFNVGSVVVLDRPAGEMVDILVNGKCIGKGEVVVIDDNYGIRVTEINMPNAQELL